MSKGSRVLIIIFGLFLGWVGLQVLGSAEKASSAEMLLATRLYSICCLPLLITAWKKERSIPYLAFYGIFYFVYYGFSIFNKYNLFLMESLSPLTIMKCLDWAFWGFVFLLAAFYTPLGIIASLVKVRINIDWDYRKAYKIGLVLGFLGIVAQVFNLSRFLPSSLAGPGSFINNLSRVGIATLFIIQSQGKLNFKGKIFLWFGLFIPKILLDVTTGSTTYLILDFMLLFFIYYYYHRSIPWLRLCLAAMVFFVVFSARDSYRSLVWFSGYYENASTLEKAKIYIKLIGINMFEERDEAQKSTYDKISARTDAIVTFVKVTELTPEIIPYWGGYTYSTLLTSLMPRFILPDKPTKILGQEFGHRYRFLSPDDDSTAYNLPQLIEMYINFSIVGIIAGMFIMGIIFRIFYGLFNSPEGGEGGLLMGTMVFINLLNMESDFSLVFGAILQYAIVFYIIARMMRLPTRSRENGSIKI